MLLGVLPVEAGRSSSVFQQTRLREKETLIMPHGDKSAYTDKQKRQAEHIEESYETRGVPEDEAEKRAWATVNKMTEGGKKSGSGRGHSVNKTSARQGGKKASTATPARVTTSRSTGAKKAAQTRPQQAKALTTKKTGAQSYSYK
jgi:plasmid stabilization system protein ParE